MTVTFHIGTPAPIAQYYLLREHIVSDATYSQFANKAEPLVKSKAPQTDKAVVALNRQISAFKPQNVVGSGPFVVNTNAVSDSQMRLSKNPKCYFVDKIHFDTVIDYASFDFKIALYRGWAGCGHFYLSRAGEPMNRSCGNWGRRVVEHPNTRMINFGKRFPAR